MYQQNGEMKKTDKEGDRYPYEVLAMSKAYQSFSVCIHVIVTVVNE